MHQISTPKISVRLGQLANLLVAIIIVLLPFHALFTTWIGSNFGHADLFKIWKELLLVPLGGISLWFLATTPTIKQRVLHSWLFWLTVGYVLLTIGWGVWSHRQGHVNSNALIYGLIINLRFVTFLLFTWIIALKSPWLHKNWQALLLGPALLVISFAVLQWLVLPHDVLKHVGYGPHTIPAIQTVDQQTDYRRLQSTLRGANPLGAYLVVIMTAMVGLLLTNKNRRGMGSFLVFVCGLILFLSYSRSAYLGAILGVGLLLWLLSSKIWRQRFLVMGIVGFLVLAVGVFVFRHNTRVENVFFHSSEKSQSAVSSNTTRASDIQQGLKDVQAEPIGRGPGTAGPASVRNNHPARIAENYYIQIAQEVGVVGLGLFIAINVVVAWELWQRRQDLLAVVLLCSLLGLTLVNMLSHAWADDTLSLIWWGFAGVALAQPLARSAILNKRQTHGKKSSSQKIKTS